jgi:hypothetical protein
MPTGRGEIGRETVGDNIPVITAATAYGITDQSCASLGVYPKPTIIVGSYS